jgi:C_GCAxxG_C_C family probable redox protein
VFSAVAERMGFDYETACKVSCGFGGGMYLGSVCGAVTGGIMAIGVKHGGVGLEPSMRTGKIVRDFAERFKARHGSINCPELIGIDLGVLDPLNHPEVIAMANEKGVFDNCPGFVRDAAGIVNEMLSGSTDAHPIGYD